MPDASGVPDGIYSVVGDRTREGCGGDCGGGNEACDCRRAGLGGGASSSSLSSGVYTGCDGGGGDARARLVDVLGGSAVDAPPVFCARISANCAAGPLAVWTDDEGGT